MKSKLILLLLLLFSSINYSQNQTKINFTKNDKLIYLDSLGKKTSESDHLYYRIVKDYKLDKASYQVYDFYKSGALHVEGTSGNKEWVLKNGLFVFYYENGTKKMTANFVNRIMDGKVSYWFENGNKKAIKNYVKGSVEGESFQWYENGNTKSVVNYLNGRMEGENTQWYENGNKKSITNYVKGRPDGKEYHWYENGNKKMEGECIQDTKNRTSENKIIQFWDVNGVQKVIDGNGDYEETEKNSNASGKVKNGYKDGVWIGKHTDTIFSYTDTYRNTKFISGVSIDEKNVTRKYTEIQKQPTPEEGIPDFMSHIGRNFQTPKVEGLSGKILVRFVVETDGSIEDIKVLKDLGHGTAEEAIRVVKSYGGWIPGERRGRKVRCFFLLPLNIHTNR
jgi:antitoxin component YwqK of YwqJK toxin-antitoxin module